MSIREGGGDVYQQNVDNLPVLFNPSLSSLMILDNTFMAKVFLELVWILNKTLLVYITKVTINS